jgi:hypothetical protein
MAISVSDQMAFAALSSGADGTGSLPDFAADGDRNPP